MVFLNNSKYVFVANATTYNPIKVCDTTNGFASLTNESVLTLRYKEYSTDIDFSGTTISLLHAAEYKENLYALIRNKDFLYALRFDYKDARNSVKRYSLHLDDYKNMFAPIEDGIMICTESNSILVFSPDDSKEYEEDNEYIGSFKRLIDIPTNEDLSDISFNVRGVDYIPINGTRKMVAISDKATIVTFDFEGVFDGTISFVKKGGTKDTPLDQVGLSTILITSTNVIILDMLDMTGYIHYHSAFISATEVDGHIAIYSNDKLLLMDSVTLDIFKTTCNIIGRYYLYSSNDSLFAIGKNSYKLTMVKDLCIVTKTCINHLGEKIWYEDTAYQKSNKKITIAPPLVPNYESNEDSIEVTLNLDVINLVFAYCLKNASATINVTAKCYDEVIDTHSVYAVIGEEYFIESRKIEGYSFIYGENTSGICDRNTIEATMFYVPDNEEVEYEAFADITVVSYDESSHKKESIHRLVPLSKLVDVFIQPPPASFHKPLESSIFLGNVSYGIVSDSCDYEETSYNTKKFIGMYKGIEVFDDFVKIENSKIVTNFSNGISCTVEDTDDNILYGNIDIDSSYEYELIQFIDVVSSKVMHRYFGAPILLKELSIQNMKLVRLESHYKGILKITKLSYTKIESNIRIIHKIKETGAILKESNFTGKIGSKLFYTLVDDQSLSLIGYKEDLFFAYDDYTKVLEYKEKSVSVKYQYINLYGDVLSEDVFTYTYGKSVVLPSPTSFNEFSIVSNPIGKESVLLTNDLSFKIYLKEDFYSLYFEKRINSNEKIRFKTSLSKTVSNKLIVKSDKDVISDCPLYIVKGTCSKRTKDDLTNEGIRFVETERLWLEEVVYLNGDFYDHSMHKDIDVSCNSMLITVDCKFKDYIRTIEEAMSSVVGEVYISSTPKEIKSELEIVDVKTELYTDRVSLKVAMRKDEVETITKTFTVIDPISLNEVHTEDVQIKTSEDDFSLYEYSLTSVESNVLTHTSRGTIDISDRYSDYILSFVLNIKGTDYLGNTSPIVSRYFELYTKNLNIEDKDDVVTYNHSLSRVNNRYKGPRESYKFINVYDGIKKTCAEISSILKKRSDDIDEV